MTTMFIVYHARKVTDEFDDEKLIGVFDSMELAENAVNYLKSKPGFVSIPAGFHIDRYEVNRINWQDGFVL